MILKIKFKKIKVAHGLIKKKQELLYSFFRLLTHPLRIVMAVMPFPPSLFLVEYPINLVILSRR
jgi:hypothetical protein